SRGSCARHRCALRLRQGRPGSRRPWGRERNRRADPRRDGGSLHQRPAGVLCAAGRRPRTALVPRTPIRDRGTRGAGRRERAASTCLVGLGAVATAALTGALWTWLYSRGLLRRVPAGAALSLAGAIPYVAFALVVRALVCKPVAFLAAGRFLALRPDDQLAYQS